MTMKTEIEAVSEESATESPAPKKPDFDFVENKEASKAACQAKTHMRVQKLPVEHRAFVVDEGEVEFRTESGIQTAKKGDIVIYNGDHAWPVSSDYFEKNYKITGHGID